MNKIQQVFQRKRWAYIRTFLGANGKPNPEAAIVLADLRRLARIDSGGIVVSPISRTVDPYASIYRAGLRDMYLRISNFIGLDEAAQPEETHHDGTDRAITD